MRTKTIYEWSIETCDSEGEVLDIDFVGSASALLHVEQWFGDPPDGQYYRLVLVRSEWESFGRNGIGDLVDRSWAFLINRPEGYLLPKCFGGWSYGKWVAFENEVIPKRFHAELTRAVKHASK